MDVKLDKPRNFDALDTKTSVSNLVEHLLLNGFERHKIIDGDIWHCKQFLDDETAVRLFEDLLKTTRWTQPVVKMGNRIVNSPRLAAWHGDPEAVYTYSGLRNSPADWNPALIELRDRLETVTAIRFNSVLLNYYRDGNDSMGWHRDNEPELGKNPVVASVSLGTTRRFLMKHIRLDDQKMEFHLAQGSALLMVGETQHNWKHSVPKTRAIMQPRINLTFRVVQCPT